MNNKRLKWIDGLTGLAVLGIFFHHFLMKYYPATYYGSYTESYSATGLDARFADMPFFCLINGNFYSFLFILLSGFIVARCVMRMKPEDLGPYMIRRYVRLTLPIFIACTLMWLLYRCGLQVSQAYLGETPGFLPVVFMAFGTVLISGDQTYICTLGIMQNIFLGGMLAALLACISWKGRRKAAIVASAIITLLLFFGGEYQYSIATMGAVLALCEDWIVKSASRLWGRILAILLIILGLFLAAYPSGVEPESIYRYISISRGVSIWHYLGATLILLAFMMLPLLQKAFENPVFLFLGYISYGFYIFYDFIANIYQKVLDPVLQETWDYSASFAINLAVTLTTILLVSFLYKHFIGRRLNPNIH